MSNHSKGPWKIIDGESYNTIVDADGVELMCDLDYYPSVPSKDEDWDLIAAGPELLEALIECVEDSQAVVDQYVLNYGENWRPARLAALRAGVEKARAAIKKATGEQS